MDSLVAIYIQGITYKGINHLKDGFFEAFLHKHPSALFIDDFPLLIHYIIIL